MTDKPETSKITPGQQRPQTRKGVEILSKHELTEGVRTESKSEGGSLETQVEIGTGVENRDKEGRRVFEQGDE